MSRLNLDFARAAARARWGRATAFRIGLIVGELGLKTANPYLDGTRGRAAFEEGRDFSATRPKPR